MPTITEAYSFSLSMQDRASLVGDLYIDWLLVIGIQTSINRLSRGDKVCVGGSL